MLKVGIVGLPNVGKSTLFNALVRRYGAGHAAAAVGNYPFTTVEPNVGVLVIPDEQIAAVARVAGSAKVTPATIELVDIAGLVKGAARGEGLGNEFLSNLRPMDALLHVVRAFEDPQVARAGFVGPKEDIETVRAELAAKDAEIRERRKEEERRTKNGTGGETELAAKPVLYIFNVGEGKLEQPADTGSFAPAVVLTAKIEAEVSELPAGDQAMFLREYGLARSRTEEVLPALLKLLNVVSFFTANENEARAWTVPSGTTAREAAGVVHSDFERGFIRAETIAWDRLVAAGSYEAAREQGILRDEGKAYVVHDGDVFVFKTGA